MLNKSNIKKGHSRAKYGDVSFNCWGATLHALGINSRLYWVEEPEIYKVVQRAEKVKGKLMVGDILVLWSSQRKNMYDIQHTAVYVGGGKWWHKRGGLNSEFASKLDIIEDYEEYANFFEIKRLTR